MDIASFLKKPSELAAIASDARLIQPYHLPNIIQSG